MPTHLTCPHGHRWEPATGDLAADGPLICPVCKTTVQPGENQTPGLDPSGAPTPPYASAASRPFTHTEHGTPPATAPQAGAATEPVAVPGYEIEEELGRGGMGVVYRARQTRPSRLVALKMILAGVHAGAEHLARFKREAEAIAQLAHPNIVQVYEVGEHNGQPFFAMELIEGGSLAARLDGTPQPARAAAELIETLARAMHFAHQRGIIHRDLKPANVLLQRKPTADYTDNTDKKKQGDSSSVPSVVSVVDFLPKITDFGLAKRLDEQGQTQSGAVMGTPAYMAPEQAAGKTREIGPATDLYALGAILYELLTGRPPFKGATSWETIEQAVGAEPVPPRRLQPKLPTDLETICLKCLQKKPPQRYASAGDLADDLRRFLHHEPIRARPVPLWRRGLMWARRRPALATLLSVGGLAAAALVAVVVVANAMLRARNDALEAALGRTKQAVRDAERERALAQEHFQRALEAADQMLSQVGDGLAGYPHMEQERRRILEKALKFFQEFLRHNSADPLVRREAAWAYRRTARIYELLGKDRRAEQDLRRAVALQEELTAQFPDEPTFAADLAASYNALGLLYRVTSPTRAEPAIRKALAIFERLNREHPDHFTQRYNLAITGNNLAVVLQAAGRNDQAEKAYRAALARWQQLDRDYPKRSECRRQLASGYNNLGALYKRTGRWDQAGSAFQSALAALKRLTAAQLEEPKTRHELAKVHNSLGTVYGHAGRWAESDRASLEALALWEKLAEEFPAVLEYRNGVGMASMNRAIHLQEVGQPKRALTAYEKARAVGEELVRQQPRSVEYRHNLARVLLNLGLLAWQSGRRQDGEKSCRQALPLWRDLVRADPRAPSFQDGLAATHLNLGMMAHATDRLAEAEGSFEKALELWQKLDRRYPGSLSYQRGLAKCHYNLAVVRGDQGQAQQAREANRKARALLSRLVQREPRDTDFQADLARALRQQSQWLLQDGQPDQAAAALRQALKVRKRLAGLYPPDSPYQAALARQTARLANDFSQVGETYARGKRPADARKLWREALAVVEPLARRYPGEMSFQRQAAAVYYNLGTQARKNGRAAEAEAAYKKLVDLRKALLAPGPQRAEYGLWLGWSYAALGELSQASKPRLALDWYARAIEVLQEVLREKRPPAEAARTLGGLYLQRAQVLSVLNRHAEALADVDRASGLRQGKAPGALPYVRATILARMGNHAQAVRDAEAAAGKDPRDGNTLYNLACVHALASAAARKDDKRAAGEREKLAERYATRAVELLARARAAGYFKVAGHVADLDTDPDLEPLRPRADYKRLYGELKKMDQPGAD
jgi:serine/threonine protein kinase/tetratricopeptide (TPR) repeat protein